MLLSLALAATCDPQAAVATLRAEGAGLREAYLCVATAPEGLATLRAVLDTTAGTSPSSPVVAVDGVPARADGSPLIAERTRLTRATALWLLCHPDAAWDADVVRQLGADDRRLLADGVHAVRGRASPAPEHARVYAQFDWYKPDARYTDRRLTPTDLTNIALADSPPPPAPPVQPEPSPAAPPAEDAPVATAAPGCGCGDPGASPGLGTLGWIAATLLRRARPRRGEVPPANPEHSALTTARSGQVA